MVKIFTLLSLICSCHFSNLFAQEWGSLAEGQKFQKELDDKYFSINEGFEKLRHVLLHLVDTTGKIAAYCETKEHGREPDSSVLLNEVLPDLLMHTLQIANLYGVDLSEKYAERVQFIVNRARASSP